MSRNYYQNAVRAQRHGENGTSAKDAMRGLAGISLIASAMFWGPIQWQLVGPTTWGEICIAVSGALFIIIGPPVLVSFLIPWSPGGMLLAKLKWRTTGQSVVLVCGLFLVYYSFTILMSWWAARPIVAEAGMERMQTVIGLIAYILVPALLWAPVSSEEMAEELKQAQLVERYKIQTAADIAILQTTLLRAQQKAAVGFANLAAGERQELADVMRGLVFGIDQTMQEISGNLSTAAGMAFEFRSPMDTDDLPQLLDYVANELATGRMTPVNEAQPLAQSRDLVGSRSSVARPVPTHQDALEPLQEPLSSNPQGNAGQRRATQGGDATMLAAQRAVGAVWTVKQLAEALQAEESTARGLLNEWLDSGWVVGLSLKGRYSFTESGN